MLSGPVALCSFDLNPSKVSSDLKYNFFQCNVVYLPSVFQITSTKLLISYICDIPIHHKGNKQAELTRGRVD